MNGDMRDFYNDPAEQAKWGGELIAQGLFPTEKHLVEKYFRPGATVLNVGSGGGREAFALVEMGYRVTAVDYTPAFVDACRAGAEKRGLPITVQQADATALPFANASFDHVMMVGQLLGHIRGRENRLQALREIRRVGTGAAIVSTNAIERRWLYRLYFFAANARRKLHNPHGLDADDAFVRRIGGRAARGQRPVFHWYRVATFTADAEAAGWHVNEALHRYRFESTLAATAESGETFYALRKETSCATTRST